MVVLNDDARGLNPAAYGGPSWQLDVFQLLDKVQAQRLLDLQGSQQYGVDFRGLSAEGKPAGYRYPFSLNLLLH